MAVPEAVTAISSTAIIVTSVVAVLGILGAIAVTIINAQNTSASLSQLVEAEAINRGIETSEDTDGNTTNVTTNDGN